MFCKYLSPGLINGLSFVFLIYIVKCELINKSTNDLDTLSNRLKNRFCKNEFAIKFKVYD